MAADARLSTHPIQQHIADELQAANAFDAITYQKGQAVLRMFEAHLGPDVFRAGVRAYIRARAFSNATTADLCLALGKASHVNMDQVAAAWIEQPGFPLISVAASCDSEGRRDISLSQSRFLLRGTVADGSHWSVPLRIRAGIGANPGAVLLTRDGQTMPAGRCDEPLSVNADAIGFYRLHAVAKASGDETEQQRYYSALMEVRDPQLARQAARIAMSGEIPPQGAHWRLRLLVVLAQGHPQLAWNTFIDNSEALLSPHPKYAPLITSQYVPEYFWNAAEPDRIEAWVRAHVAAQMSQNVERGMEAARFRRSEQQSLIGAINAMPDSPR